jgi:hypothetical protein
MKAKVLLLGMLTGLAACAPPGANVVYSQEGNVSRQGYTHVSGVAERRSATEDAISLIAGSAGYAYGHAATGGTMSTLNTSAAIESASSTLNPPQEKTLDDKAE